MAGCITSVWETLLEQTFGLFTETLCGEGLATGVCNTIAACYDPFIETIANLCTGGK